MNNKKNLFIFITVIFVMTLSSLALGFYFGKNYENLFLPDGLINPFISQQKQKELPLLKYSIPKLQKRDFEDSEIKIEELIEDYDEYTSYLFSYTTMGKKMTGQLNIPKLPPGIERKMPRKMPVIVMIRGWVPRESYYSGMGTKNAAAVFAKEGYITLAPDFFSYGGSDDEPENTWEARFIKPINVIELIKTVRESSKIEISDEQNPDAVHPSALKLSPSQIGIWAHSNGGQIALASLEILEEPIPTTLWAPVTVPFPYSILFFTDENEDEGKEARAWLAMFEADYDVLDFTITQHLDKLTGPIQLHHGNADEAALQMWSDEFMLKIEAENEKREDLLEENKEDNGEKNTDLKEAIEIIYLKYPGADHNMKPVWNKVIQRDLEFFEEKL